MKETVQKFATQNNSLTDENTKLLKELKDLKKTKRELKDIAKDVIFLQNQVNFMKKTEQIGIIQNATVRDQEHLNYQNSQIKNLNEEINFLRRTIDENRNLITEYKD